MKYFPILFTGGEIMIKSKMIRDTVLLTLMQLALDSAALLHVFRSAGIYAISCMSFA